MHERLMEILVQLLKEIHSTSDIMVTLKDISEQLRQQGYSETELSMALSWLNTQLQRQNEESQSVSPLHSSIRVLHPVERMMLNADAYGYLLHLEHLGLIEKDQIETIIEKAIASGKSEITIHDVKMMLASLVIDAEQTDWTSSSAMWSEDDNNLKVH